MRERARVFPLLVFAWVSIPMVFGTAGCTGSVPAVEERSGALTAPTLQSHAGLLCFTETPRTTADGVATVSAPDSGGWVEIHRPHARAVLGGTLGSYDLLSRTNLDFQVTGFNTDWNADIYGPRAQVCALLAARDPCNLAQVCWRADGRISIESKSNPGVETAAECGEQGKTINYQTAAPPSDIWLPPLTVGHTYSIRTDVADDDVGNWYAVTNFFMDGQSVTNGYTLGPRVLDWTAAPGLSGVETDRLTAKVRITGAAPWTQATVAATAVATEGDVLSEGPVTCSYYAQARRGPIVAYSGAPIVTTMPAVDPSPAGFRFEFAHYPVTSPEPFGRSVFFRDGYARRFYGSSQCAGVGVCFDTDVDEMYPDTTYVYEVGWVDASGVPSILTAFDAHSVPPPTGAAAFHQGQMRVAVVLAKLHDAPATLYSRSDVQNWFFGGPGSISVAEYFREVTVGQLAVTGDVFDWIDLGYSIGDRCHTRIPADLNPAADPTGSILAAGGLGYDCDLHDIQSVAAGQLGVSFTGYDKIVFLVTGVGTNGIDGAGSMVVGASKGPVALHAIIHEMGHSFGVDHAGDWVCPKAGGGTGIGVGPDITNASTGSCSGWRYGTQSPMGIAVRQFNTADLYRMGWMSAAESTVAQSGQSYFIEGLDSATGVLRQLRIPLSQNAFYFVEYRVPTGANGFPACFFETDHSCAPDVEWGRVPNEGSGVFVWLFKDSNRNAANFNDETDDDTSTLAVTPTAIGAGSSFVDPYRKVTVNVLANYGNKVRVQVLMCGDGQMTGTETDVDCGGACPPCGLGQKCGTDADCQAGLHCNPTVGRCY